MLSHLLSWQSWGLALAEVLDYELAVDGDHNSSVTKEAGIVKHKQPSLRRMNECIFEGLIFSSWTETAAVLTTHGVAACDRPLVHNIES